MNLEDTADRAAAEKVECPHCGAPPGETCARRDGSRIENYAAHADRLIAAKVRHAPLDTREYTGGQKRRSEAHRAR